MNQREIEAIYKKYKTPKSIIAHMNAVAKICLSIAKSAREKGIKVNTRLLIQAAKLHDSIRPCDFRDFDEDAMMKIHTKSEVNAWKSLRRKYGNIGHARGMHDILIKMNEPKLARLVEMHDFGQIDNLKTWDEKILYYADKRVDRDKIVPMEQRMAEGKKRNFKEGDCEKSREIIMNKLRKLEKELIHHTGCSI